MINPFGRVTLLLVRNTDRKDLDAYKAEHQVISTHLKAGRTIIHVYSEMRPNETFETSPANLEDVYFTEITARSNAVTV